MTEKKIKKKKSKNPFDEYIEVLEEYEEGTAKRTIELED